MSQAKVDWTSEAPRSSRPPASLRPEPGVTVEDMGPVRRVVLNRRSRKNALSQSMYGMLTEALGEAAASDSTAVVLLTSAGGAFSVGNDIGEGAVDADAESVARAALEFLRTLISFPKPVVAAVNGLAAGVGAAMLLHCDFVVASPFAVFEYSSARLAHAPDAVSAFMLQARLGLQRASEWMLLGERISAQTAYQCGLVNAVVPLEELAPSARVRAEALAALPQSAVRDTKRLLREPLRAALDEALERELGAISSGVARREPRWSVTVPLAHSQAAAG
jgi:enoyl-CoA hydratase/carnithine racemase